MAKKKETETKRPEVKVEKPKERRPAFFPKLLLLFSLIVMALAVVDYFNFFRFPRPAIDIVLFLAGLWMLKLGFERGFYRRRKEILKRYI